MSWVTDALELLRPSANLGFMQNEGFQAQANQFVKNSPLFNGRKPITRAYAGNPLPSPSYKYPTTGLIDSMSPFASGDEDQSSTDSILDQLRALSDPSRYMNDSGIEEGARAAASAQYDPVIAGLRSQAAAATRRGEQNQKSVIDIFNQLGGSLQGDIPGIQKNYDETTGKSNQQYDQLNSGIEQQYNDTQKQQEDLFQRLNIQAAAPGITPGQARDKEYFVNRSNTDKQTQAAALTTEKQGAVDYAQKGSSMARTEGTQRSADIMSQLTELLNQYNDKIGANEAAKAQAYTANKSQMQQQSQKNALDRSQSDFNNFLASINLGRGLNSDALDAQVKMAGLNKTTGVKTLQDVPKYLMSLGLDQGAAQRGLDTFVGGLSQGLIKSGLDPQTGSNATPEAKAEQIVEQARQQGLSGPEINALRDAALQYFGRG